MADTRLNTPSRVLTAAGRGHGDDGLLEKLADLPEGCPERERVKARVVAEKLPLAARLARRYRGCGEPYEDLRQVAALGLVKAVNGYDPRRGKSFSAYAVPTILGELRRHFRDHGWSLRVPRGLKDARRDLALAASDLAQQLGRTPHGDEIAARAGMSQDRAREALVADAAYDASSLDAAGIPGGAGRHEFIGESDARLETVPDRAAVRGLLRRLPERERHILALRYFHDLTQRQISEKVGISQMHVSRLLGKTLGHLREALLADAGNGTNIFRSTTLDIRRFADNRVHVSVHGRLDRHGAERLWCLIGEFFRDGVPHRMVVDLAQACAVDRSGAAALCYACLICRRTGTQLVLANVRSELRPALRDAGLDLASHAAAARR